MPLTAVTLFRRAGRLALDLVFPPRCLLCGRGGDFLCHACARALPRAHPPRCRICWLPSPAGVCPDCLHWPPPFTGLRSAFRMEEGAREAVHALKYRGMTVLAEPMGAALADVALDWQVRPDVITAVPLHWRRRRQRGYNQSAEMAAVVAGRLGLPLEGQLLRRVRPSPPQAASAGLAERRRNVEGAFEAGRAASARAVLLVDDVATSGATMSACATALRAAGASAVWGLTFARED